MNIKFTSPLFWVSIISALKVVLDTIGIQVVNNQQVDTLANGVAVVFVIIGIFVDHGFRQSKVLTPENVLDAVAKIVADLQPIVTLPTTPATPLQTIPSSIPTLVSSAAVETSIETSGNASTPTV